MNSDREMAAQQRALEEVERFGRMLREIEREEATDLEDLLQLEYGGDDAAMVAEDEMWTDLSAWPRPATSTKRRKQP